MIQEVTQLTVDPSRSADFETAVASCRQLFLEAKGCRAMRLDRVLENAGQYRLRIDWETRDDHIVTFRQSPAYAVWRSRVGPFFTADPVVSHTELVTQYF